MAIQGAAVFGPWAPSGWVHLKALVHFVISTITLHFCVHKMLVRLFYDRNRNLDFTGRTVEEAKMNLHFHFPQKWSNDWRLTASQCRGQFQRPPTHLLCKAPAMFLMSAAKKLVGILQFFTQRQIGFVRRNCTAQRDVWEKRNQWKGPLCSKYSSFLSSLPKKEPPYLLNCIPLSSLAHLLSEPPSLPVSPPFPLFSTFAYHTAAVGRWRGQTWRPL